MSSILFDHVDEYLRLRRALGYKLERAGHLLPQFIDYLHAADATVVTSDLAISWSRLATNARPNYWAARLAIVRGFARYLQTFDPATEIPPSGVFPARRHRPAPYLWSEQDIADLLRTAATLVSPLRAATYQALFGLLAVSGMRVGEAIGLDSDDLDVTCGVITIRHAKFDRPRLVPLHPTTTTALHAYLGERDRLSPTAASAALFITSTGTRLNRSAVAKTLRQLTSTTGLRTETVHPTPHHLRHSFAVRTMIDWHRSGVRIDDHIAALSTYLGHVSPADTYWYLSASPELMALAADRLATHTGGQR
jgi:integrase/recombinase XerD